LPSHDLRDAHRSVSQLDQNAAGQVRLR
jgi:hypothetical protein